MKVIIIGAGMGGLSAGIALKRIGYEVKIYEQVTENKPVGAAISVWSNGVKCMNYLGLHEQMVELGGLVDYMSYADAFSGEIMTRFSLDPLVRQVGQRPYPVSRADLQSMLMHAFGMDEIHFGMRMQALVEEDEKVTVTFTDGSSATGDIMIGADGAKSLTREYVLGGPVQRHYASYVNFNGLVPVSAAIAPADEWRTFVGDCKRVSVMPIAGNSKFYYFFDVPLPAGLEHERSQTREVLREHFAGWAPPVQTLIETIDAEATNRVEIWDLDPIHTWVKGRVALLGDAGHNTAPDIGQGGCAAMEDAVALSIALSTNTLSVQDSLLRYQKKRSTRAGELVLRARRRSEVTHGQDLAATKAWYDELWHEDGANIIAGIVKNIEGHPLD